MEKPSKKPSKRPSPRPLSRIQQLLGQPDLAFQTGGREKGYIYRPRQYLCAAEEVAAVERELKKVGIDSYKEDRWANNCRCWRPSMRIPLVPPRKRPINLTRLGLARRYVPPDINIPTIVEYVRKDLQGVIKKAMAPNYVTLGEQWWAGEPATAPVPMTPSQAATAEAAEAAEMARLGFTTGSIGRARRKRVGVVDTGIDRFALVNHPAFAGSYTLDPNDVDVLDGPDANLFLDREAGHGTFVAGIIRRRVPGVALEHEPGLNPAGIGDATDILDRAAELAKVCDVINLSLGCYTDGDLAPPGLDELLDICAKRGVAVVAAAGNQNHDRKFWPAADPRVISVGSVERKDAQVVKADYSNFGPWLRAWTLGSNIPGLYVTGTWDPAATNNGVAVQFDNFAKWSGTSFATPRVAAAIVREMDASGTADANVAAASLLASAAGSPGPQGNGVLIDV